MAFLFKLPDVGEGIHEAEIVRWLVAEGDHVEEDQPLVEVQTDKALVELPSPKAGVIGKLHFAAGDIAPTGAVLVTIVTDPSESQDGRSSGTATVIADHDQDRSTVTVTDASPKRRKVLATPATRRLARELGIDIQLVPGTGPGGRVTDDDVRRFKQDSDSPLVPAARQTPTHTSDPTAGTPSEERIPIRGVRRRIAERMVTSKFTAPHATLMDEVDVTELVAIRRQALDLAAKRGLRLTYLPFIIKAVVTGLREYPLLNASIDEQTQEIIVKRYYHLGIATDTEEGLIVPVVTDADQKSIFQLAAEIETLVKKARERRLALDELRGSTFTITNAGSIGGIFSTPIINYPEVAILGVHRIKEQPVVKEGQIVARHILTLALSFDHRIIDGAYAARFLNRVMSYLEQPSLLFMELI